MNFDRNSIGEKKNKNYFLQAEPCEQKEVELWDGPGCAGTASAQCGRPSPRPLLPPRHHTKQSKRYW